MLEMWRNFCFLALFQSLVFDIQGSKQRFKYCSANCVADLAFRRAVSCLDRAVKHVSIQCLLRWIPKKKVVYYYVISYIYTKGWIFTFLWKAKWAFRFINSNSLRFTVYIMSVFEVILVRIFRAFYRIRNEYYVILHTTEYCVFSRNAGK